jgi:1,4-dihydroxy-2-naphthoate octaprenyltransferase
MPSTRSGNRTSRSSTASPESPSNFEVWLLAVRPKTLAAGAVPVLVGIAAAALGGPVSWTVALVTLSAALLLQIASNLANDYYDFLSGVDTEDRLGPVRVTQAGLLAPSSVRNGLFVVLAASLLLGAFLVLHGGLPILVIGVASAGGALAYSAGPWPLSRYGFGEPMAFLFFGVVAVTGTYYLQRGTFDATSFVASVPVGCLAAALISVNNLRDVRTDRAAGKRTLAVRFGESPARAMFLGFLGVAYAVAFYFACRFDLGAFAVALTLPLAFREGSALYRRDGAELNLSLGGTARLELFFGVAFAAGILA